MKIPYGKQFIDEEDIQAVSQTLKSDFLTQGPEISLFEKELAEYHKVKYCVLFSNGTAALHGCYSLIEKKEDGELIAPPLTFAATMNGGIYEGLRPVFADIDPKTLSISYDCVKKVINSKTKAIASVSYAGYMPPSLKDLYELCEEKGILLIHDAAHAIGAKAEGFNIADYAHLTILSFHPVKHLTTGEGGAVLTNNEDFYKKLLLFRSHGITKDHSLFKEGHSEPWFYEMQSLGYNYRMCDIQASLGRSQLKKLNLSLHRRNEIASFYNENLKNLPLELPFSKIYSPEEYLKEERGSQNCHSFHLYPILCKDSQERLNLYNFLKEKGIYTQVHYIPTHIMPYYKETWGTKEGDFPISEDFYSRELSLPMYLGLKDEELIYVVKSLKDFFNLDKK